MSLQKEKKIERYIIHWDIWVILWSLLISHSGPQGTTEQTSHHNGGFFICLFVTGIIPGDEKCLALDNYVEVTGKGKYLLDPKQFDRATKSALLKHIPFFGNLYHSR